jgi:hypothetical protein
MELGERRERDRESLVVGVIRSFDRGSRAWWRSSFSEKVLVELHFTWYYFAGVKKKSTVNPFWSLPNCDTLHSVLRRASVYQ